MKDPQIYRQLQEEAIGELEAGVRDRFKQALSDVFPFKLGHDLAWALQESYRRGVRDGYVQGVAAAVDEQEPSG